MSNNKRLSILAVVLAAVLWGSTGTLQALLPEHKQPLVVGALRLYFAAIYLLVIAVIFGQKLVSSILRAPILIAFSGLFMMLYNIINRKKTLSKLELAKSKKLAFAQK